MWLNLVLNLVLNIFRYCNNISQHCCFMQDLVSIRTLENLYRPRLLIGRECALWMTEFLYCLRRVGGFWVKSARSRIGPVTHLYQVKERKTSAQERWSLAGGASQGRLFILDLGRCVCQNVIFVMLSVCAVYGILVDINMAQSFSWFIMQMHMCLCSDYSHMEGFQSQYVWASEGAWDSNADQRTLKGMGKLTSSMCDRGEEPLEMVQDEKNQRP